MQLAGIGVEISSRGAVGASSPRLVSAAHEFEGQMMKELLAPVTDGDVLTGTDDDTGSRAGSGGVLGEFASEMLGRALSEHGGFGIAHRLIQQLSHTGNTPGNGRVEQKSRPKAGSESFSMTKVMRRI